MSSEKVSRFIALEEDFSFPTPKKKESKPKRMLLFSFLSIFQLLVVCSES
jgi:hypothetical protein